MEKGKGILMPNLKLSVPPPDEISFSRFLAEGSTIRDCDLLDNKDGVRNVSQSEPESEALNLSRLGEDNQLQLNLEDLDVIKDICQSDNGIVQLVQHKQTEHFFALKIIKKNIEESLRRRFEHMRLTQSFQCPHLVVYYKSFYDNGSISTLLEYMDGGSMAGFLEKVKWIPEPYLAAICKQVLKGLIYLHHKAQVIHRDIKPSKLLINHRGEVKISSSMVSAELISPSGRANTFVGTYNYMSPERIIGDSYGTNVDIWSLGLVLLECATGKFPYLPPEPAEGWTNFYELMECVVEGPAPCAPSDRFSPEFCSFISACLQKEPEERKSAEELLELPFVTMYDDQEVDLSSYFSSAGSPVATP